MPILRLPVRGMSRTIILRTPARALATSAPLHSIRSAKQAGPRNLRRSAPISRQQLPSTTPKSAPGATQRSNSETPEDASHQQPEDQPALSRVQAISAALRDGAENSENSLNAPVHIPEDPHSVLKTDHPATSILANSSVVVQRQLEMMNVLMGFEQANRYIIMDGQGNHIGYLAEQENGFGGTMARQMFKTHRSFTTHVFDKHEREVLRFHRPFSWINSKIRVYDAVNGADHSYSPSDALQGTSATSLINQTSAQISPLPLSAMRIIGEAQQQWAPLRRKYNLFLARDPTTVEHVDAPQLTSGDLPLSSSKSLTVASPSTADPTRQTFAQFAYVNEPWLSWDFSLLSDDSRLLGSVNRNFGGFAREIFTDTDVYALRMDAASLLQEPSHLISHTAQKAAHEQPLGMTLDQRAIMLATAVSIDFDYFSRHSGAVGGMGLPIPIWIPGGGGAAAEGAVAGAGEVGAAGRAVGGVAGTDSAGAAAAGAGTMVGYEAMQRQRGMGAEEGDGLQHQGERSQPQQGEEVWGEQNPWDEWGGGGGGGAPPSGGASGGGGDGDGGFDFNDFF